MYFDDPRVLVWNTSRFASLEQECLSGTKGVRFDDVQSDRRHLTALQFDADSIRVISFAADYLTIITKPYEP